MYAWTYSNKFYTKGSLSKASYSASQPLTSEPQFETDPFQRNLRQSFADLCQRVSISRQNSPDISLRAVLDDHKEVDDVHVRQYEMSLGWNTRISSCKDDAPPITPFTTMKDHLLPLEEVVLSHNTSIEYGLNDSQIQPKRKVHGLNKLSPPKEPSTVFKFCKHLFNELSCLLWVASVLALVTYVIDPADNQPNLVLCVALIIVIVITAAFSFIQEFKSSQLMKKFLNLMPQKAVVIRNGLQREIPSELVLPGDIIVISSGDKIPADARLVSQCELRVDHSSLTGESDPVSRTLQSTHDNPFDSKNMVFGGTNVISGNAKAIVLNIGNNTVIGSIAKSATDTNAVSTPIHIEMHSFIVKISVLAVTIGLICFGVGLALGYDGVDISVFCVGIIIAMIPEGLIPTITSCLNVSAKRLSKNNVLVKNLEAVETLGSVNVLCTDKTGTLTQNKMKVQNIYIDNKMQHVYNISANFSYHHVRSFRYLTLANVLCNNGSIDGDNKFGNATDLSLLEFFGAPSTLGIERIREENPKIVEIPFTSKLKYQLSIHSHTIPNTNEVVCLLLLKGALDRIIPKCSTVMIGDDIVPLTATFKNDILRTNELFAEQGERVIGACMLLLDKTTFHEHYEFNTDDLNFPTDGLCFIGMCSISDPPRPSVPAAVLTLKAAGIKVVMVTGDHPKTAEAIARKTNIITDGCIIVSGDNISKLTAKDWDNIINHKEIVFARTSPEQKLQIVEEFQKRGNVVALTGDGVNDSPAMKRAQIGIAMGITGTDIAKDASNMILLDDEFSSIVNGVTEGRLIFENLKKSIAHTLAHTVPELITVLAFFALGLPLALSTFLTLAIDLCTEMYLAISCAYEPMESDILAKPPRKANDDPLVSLGLFYYSYVFIGIITSITLWVNYFLVMYHHDHTVSELLFTATEWVDRAPGNTDVWHEAQSSVFMTIVLCQTLGTRFAVQTRRSSAFSRLMSLSPHVVFAVIVALGSACAIVYIPQLQFLFSTQNVPWFVYGTSFIGITCILLFDELRKCLIRRFDCNIDY